MEKICNPNILPSQSRFGKISSYFELAYFQESAYFRRNTVSKT